MKGVSSEMYSFLNLLWHLLKLYRHFSRPGHHGIVFGSLLHSVKGTYWLKIQQFVPLVLGPCHRCLQLSYFVLLQFIVFLFHSKV